MYWPRFCQNSEKLYYSPFKVQFGLHFKRGIGNLKICSFVLICSKVKKIVFIIETWDCGAKGSSKMGLESHVRNTEFRFHYLGNILKLKKMSQETYYFYYFIDFL